MVALIDHWHLEEATGSSRVTHMTQCVQVKLTLQYHLANRFSRRPLCLSLVNQSFETASSKAIASFLSIANKKNGVLAKGVSTSFVRSFHAGEISQTGKKIDNRLLDGSSLSWLAPPLHLSSCGSSSLSFFSMVNQ